MLEKLTVKIDANIREFEKKMSGMQKSMDKIGGKFQSVGSTFTKGSALIVGGAAAAGAGLYGLTDKVTQTADAIAKGSERMGISTDAYQEMDFWASQNGLSQQDMEKAVGRLNQRMGLALDGNEKYASALERLGVDLGAVEDGTLSTEDAMAQSIQTLSEMENENEKAALASELFGTKLSRELMPALNDGSLSMEDAKEMAQELGIVMSEDQLKAAEEFQDAQDQIKRSMAAVGMEIGLELMPHFQRMHEWILENLPAIKDTITGAFDTVIEKVKGVIDWWKGLSDNMKTIIPIVAGVALAFGPVMLVIGKVISIVSGLISIFTPMLASITKAGGLLKWLAPLFTKIGSVMAVLTGPIGLVIAGIAALGAGFVLAYNKSETFRNFIDGLKDKFMGAWESAMEFKDKVVTAFEAIFAIFKGNEISGTTMLLSLGLSPETVGKILSSVSTIKDAFEDVKDKIGIALGAVKDFFVGAFEDIKAWWDSDGAMIFDAMQTVVENVFEGIKIAVDFALTFVQDLFERFAPIVMGIWNVLWPTVQYIVESVWETIQLVIGTAMDLIQGIISGVSALIEGDWERFGEVMKETALSIWDRVVEFFTGMKDNALELISNLTGISKEKFLEMKDDLIAKAIEMKDSVVTKFTELKDGAIGKITEMYDSVTQWFSDLWSGVTTTVTSIKDDVVSSFTGLKDDAVDRVNTMYTSVTGWFSDMWSDTTTSATSLKDDVVSSFKSMKEDSDERTKEMFNLVTGKFGELATWVDDKATGIKDDTIQAFVWMKDGVVDGVQTLYDDTTTLFDDVKSFASDTFDNMVEGAKELPGRIGDAIKGAASAAVDGVKSLGNSMGSKLGDVVDGVTGGLNGILDAIGIGDGDLIPPISIPTFSTGTRNGAIANDTLGMVNDRGPGNGVGGATQELIKRDGQIFAPRGRNAIVPLKKGDEIFNGAQTQSLMSSGTIPRFSQGTGTEGGDSGKKGIIGTLKDVVSNVWDVIQDPGKAFSALMDSVTANFDGFDGFAGKMLSGGWSMLTDGIKNFITKIFKENEGALGSGKAGNWMSYPMTAGYSPDRALSGYPSGFNGGRHYGIDYGTPRGTPITATTGGQLSSFWNEGGGKVAKLVTGELRQFFMHMQTVGPSGSVAAGDVIGKSGNSGRWTTGPHVHWQAQQGSDALNVNTIDPRKVVGHANGGIFRNNHIAEINEEGPEAIIPLSAKRRGRANSLYDSVGKAIGADDGSKEMIRNQQIQIDRLDTAINVLLGIEDKSGITESDIGRANDKYNARQTSKRGATTGRLNYV